MLNSCCVIGASGPFAFVVRFFASRRWVNVGDTAPAFSTRIAII
jgi:hypothetical protein